MSKKKGMIKMSYPNLVAEMAKRKIKRSDLAGAVGIHRNTLYWKLEKGSFYIEEAERIHEDFFPDIPMKFLFQRKE